MLLFYTMIEKRYTPYHGQHLILLNEEMLPSSCSRSFYHTSFALATEQHYSYFKNEKVVCHDFVESPGFIPSMHSRFRQVVLGTIAQYMTLGFDRVTKRTRSSTTRTTHM